MAFNKTGLQVNRGITTANAQGNGLTVVPHTYISTTDTLATILTGGYFPPYFSVPAVPSPNIVVQPINDEIFVHDLLFVEGSDATGLVVITGVNPVTLSSNLLVGGDSGITIGAPVTATDANALKLNAGILQAEIADATHPGIMTATPQTFGGTKSFSAGVLTNSLNPIPTNTSLAIGTAASVTDVILGNSSTITNVGGSLIFNNGGGAINLYEEIVLPTFGFSGPWAATLTTLLIIRLQNASVTIYVDAIPTTATTAATVATATSALPSQVIPLVTQNGLLTVLNNSNISLGAWAISPTGILTIGVGVTGSAFTNAGTSAFYNFCALYNTI